jgi:DNA-directed RNA polymerase specialized sigma24 family protein
MTRLPTPYETVFLKEFYRMYSRYHLAKMLSITEKELDWMLRHLGLRKKSKDMTDEQKDFIKENFHKMKHADIAQKIGLTVSMVQNFCFRHNLKKTGKNKFVPAPKEIIRDTPLVEAKHEKPPAEYSAGWEATIEKYLKKEI